MSDTFDFEEEPKKQTGLFVAAGGLGLLLIVLNVWPDGKTENEPGASVQPTSSTAPPAKSAPVELTRKVNWPELVFADVIRTNPFQLNQNLAEALDQVDNAESDSAESTPEEPDAPVIPRLDAAAYPVKFVFHGPRGAAAMIRDSVYHEGDTIDGMQIVQIGESGVTLRHVGVPE